MRAKGPVLLVGMGITNQAVARALVAHGIDVVAVDDSPRPEVERLAADLGFRWVPAPDTATLRSLVRDVAEVAPTPGLPETHPVFDLTVDEGTPVISEFDLAGRWDDRPVLAVTGTDGKTTVVTLLTEMLVASSRRAVACGNTETPLVEAIDDPSVEVFVVEASSFRLGHSRSFAPEVGTWLNFAADHGDVHRSLEVYEAAKARIWADQSADQIAIGNADDPVVARHLAGATARQVTFGLATADYRVLDGRMLTPEGDVLAEAGELWRSFPHDLANGLAAAATALAGGATVEGCRKALLDFRGLPHRVQLVREAGAVAWYDDSKATTPHAALAAMRAFDSVVLIAGGRNKGLDLRVLADESARVRGVVAIGEAAPEVAEAFAGHAPVRTAATMDDAVAAAASMAEEGDAVLLSPGCASFDWYRSYAERGDDYVRAVGALAGAGGNGGKRS